MDETQIGREPVIWNERLKLAALSRDEMNGAFVAALIVGFIFFLFHYLGNTVENVQSRSAFTWMVARWSDKISYGGADYSHGWLIPFGSLYAIWLRRKDILTAPKAMDARGLIFIVLGLLTHWVGAKMQQTRVSLSALILLLWAFPYYFFGWKTAKHLLFACAYLILCIPLTFLDVISFPLRLFATTLSAGVLHGLGIPVIQDGSTLIRRDDLNPQTILWNVGVEDPCSGLRSLLAMTALTAIYAYVTQKTVLRKWVLFLASIPLAIAGNIVRIITIGVSAEMFGEKFAVTLVHDYSGYIVFGVAIVIMIGIGSMMEANWRLGWQRFRAHLARAA